MMYEGDEQKFKLTIKSKGTLSRIEIERLFTFQEYSDLLRVGHLVTGSLIHKTYKVYRSPEGYILTLGSVDSHLPTQFCYGEIEFESEEEARAFVAPDWFGKEVTDDPYYKMSEYWKRTRLGE